MVKGTVSDISVKEVNTKFGMKPTFSINVDGEWYKLGFNKQGVSVGAEVEFEFKSSKWGNEVQAGTLTVGGAPAPTASRKYAATESKTAAGSAYSKPFPIPALHGDRAIVRQNSLTNAVKFLNYASATGIDVSVENVIKIARQFEAYSCGDLDRIAAEKSLKVTEGEE